jgi:hypothetical protein
LILEMKLARQATAMEAGNDNMEGQDAAAATRILVAKSFFAYVMALN